MLKLCGFAASNYYNKVKLVLLEKRIPFEEELVWASQDEAFLVRSPMGKVPFMETPDGVLAESMVILEYLERLIRKCRFCPRSPTRERRTAN